MNQLEGILVLVGLPLSLLLSGYWLASVLVQAAPLERIAFALTCGLTILLASVAAVNYFKPLSDLWAFACFSPTLLTLLIPHSRKCLFRDLIWAAKTGPHYLLIAMGVFFVILLWPVLQTSSFYDGTPGNDSFFWITGAEHLQGHTYLEKPVYSATQPLFRTTAAFTGWRPGWGRMGAEGLLALAASVIGLSPLQIYLYATASLAIIWWATIYLGILTFVAAKPARITGVALLLLQPIFIFFYSNANLPNLLGTLTGAAMIIAIERCVRASNGRTMEFAAWSTLAALSLHGLLCSYPEMVPFVLFSCGLLWLRPWLTAGPEKYWWTALLLVVFLMAGTALNPATTIRGVRGFLWAFGVARADPIWGDLFSQLHLAEYVPAIISMSVSGASKLGPWVGWPLSVLIVVVLILILRHSRDGMGLCFGLAGGLALLIYTIVTDFSYGFQKTVQFSGIFFALVFPTAAIEILCSMRNGSLYRRSVASAVIASLVGFLGFATIMNLRDIYHFSDRKVISADWGALRNLSSTTLAHAPVLVEAASFRIANFHSMWSAYFLRDSDIYFGARGDHSGGYLENFVINEKYREIPKPAAILVGREWADSFDSNSPRILIGREYALLKRSNRVLQMSGLYPLDGKPEHSLDEISMEVLPHSAGCLVLELSSRSNENQRVANWRVNRRVGEYVEFSTMVSGQSPWLIKIPLVASERNKISIVNAVGSRSGANPNIVRHLRIDDIQACQDAPL